MKSNKYLRIKSKPRYFIFLLIYFLLYPLAKILYGRKNNWIICERGNDAQDNGFVFYKYLIDNHPSINAFYIISKACHDYSVVKNIGKTVNFCSFKHFLMAIGCPVKISTHLFGYAPWSSMATYFRRNKTHDKHIFLQHGIIKNIHEGLFGNVCKSLNIFVCGAKPEYDFILKDFKYLDNVPKYTGLARYDYLNSFNTNNQILIMPTWRSGLTECSEKDFKKSRFFKNWMNLIESSEISNICLKKNIKIIFFLHPAIQKFSKFFENNNDISVVCSTEQNIQTLLKESKLLITDFSSVYFDFAYMRKPVIYFQFDEDTFYDEHYTKGYFDYRKHGFGPVCVDLKSAIHEIIAVINQDFAVNDIYSQRANLFFQYRDDKNCERIYKSIVEL